MQVHGDCVVCSGGDCEHVVNVWCVQVHGDCVVCAGGDWCEHGRMCGVCRCMVTVYTCEHVVCAGGECVVCAGAW